MKTNRNIIFTLIFALILTSCASTGKLYPSGAEKDFISNWYSALNVEAMTVDVAMTTIGTLYKAGKFSEVNKDKAIVAHAQFKLAFDDAIAKLVIYYNEPTDLNKMIAKNACVGVQIKTAVITAISIITEK